MKHLPKSLLGVFAGLLGALAMAGLVYFTAWAKEPAPTIHVDTTPIVRDTKAVTSYALVVKRAAPSVVNIFSTHIIHERLYRNPFFNDPFFRQFFGNPGDGNQREITRKEESLGSGIIISSDGYILTANHVVAGMDEIEVAIPDGNKEYTARVVGSDPPTDVAVLKIEATGLPAITLGDSDQLEVGDVVLAIGNPFEVGQSVTLGIVSALGRTGRSMDMSSSGYSIQDFIQTDAAINPGNSGGALVDADGRLVGINTMIESSSYGNEGVGFAVPINLARHVMERLIASGKVTRGYLGVRLEDLTPGLVQSFDLPDQNGVLVADVLPGAPAQKAGIQSGDTVVQFNGEQVTSLNNLQLMISECSPGAQATVKVIRDGGPKTFTVKLGELPGNTVTQNASARAPHVAAGTDALDGVTVDDLGPDARQQLQIPDTVKGAVVTQVNQDSNAFDAGLQENDVLVEINHHPVANAKDAVNLCVQAKTRRILVKVWRPAGAGFGGTLFLSVDNTKHN
jgi:serine protease Do